MLQGQLFQCLFQWRSFQRLGLILIIIIIICGLLRFVNLGEKPYWYDEVYTSLRLSGYTKVEIFEKVGKGEHNFESLQVFQCPNHDRNLGDVLNGLITDDVHPPLYFTLLYYWVKILGCTVNHIRLFSAILSLLFILASYFFIYEVFKSKYEAFIATAFVANSPIFLIYAQEARHSTLLVLLALASSLFLFRYLDYKNWKNLIFYGLFSTAGLYCHTLYYGVVFGQVGYCFFNYSLKSKFTNLNSLIQNLVLHFKSTQKILLTLLVSFLVFLIWMVRVVFIQGFQVRVGADYTWQTFSIPLLWQRIALNFTSVINDFEHSVKSELLTQNLVSTSLLDLNFSYILLIIFVCSILLCSIWYTIQYSYRSRITILGWFALPSILFLLKDLLLGGSASSIIRYQLLSIFGLYVCLSFCLVHIFKNTAFKWIRGSIIALLVLLFQMQVYSNVHYLNASSWWNKYGDYKLQEFARDVNQSSHPIIVGESNYREMVNLLKLSYVLNPLVPFQLVNKESQDDISEIMLKGYDVFWVPKI